jgi:hypothetical protein
VLPNLQWSKANSESRNTIFIHWLMTKITKIMKKLYFSQIKLSWIKKIRFLLIFYVLWQNPDDPVN